MRRVFDRYEYDIGTVVGRGGMGTVYRGIDTETGESVAIKYLDPSIVRSNPSMVERFRREGEALRELNHPNIVKMLAAGQCDDDHYLIMEYVEGGSLRDLLNERSKLIVQRSLYIMLDIADALTRAHRLEILHRDIKPGNVLIAQDGTPRLTDFGVARVRSSNMTAEGSLVGTLAYLSPESLTGQDIDERHDIWALGVMFFEMLAGDRPYPQEMVAPLITAITTQPIPDLEVLRPDLPISLVDLIYRMLEKDVYTRIRSIRMVGAELEAIIHGVDSSPVKVATSQARFRTTTATPAVPATSSTFARPMQSEIEIRNFPAPTIPFVGREREMVELRTMLEDPNRRLMTLVGPGGVGKTRLAMEIAQNALDLYPDGVYFVPLESVDNPEHVPSKIADAVGIEFGGADSPYDQVKAFMKDKHLLLVMDNLEQISEGASHLAESLEMLPKLSILATSRERLRLRGEQVYEVDNMLIPPLELTDADELVAYPSVRLFVSNAKRNAPDFELTQDNADCVNRVINLVQGMPLGIELAAGWLEMLPINEIADEIEQSLDFLETDLRDVPERHRSLRAVFEHSWQLMSPQEQDTFMKLSLFREGFDRNAALEITGASLRVLTVLGNKSLVFRSPDGRFSVPKLLRQYAQDRFFEKCDNTDEVLNKYMDFYARSAEKIGAIFGTKQEKNAAAAFELDLENIRHAWKIALMQNNLDALDRMVSPFYEFAMSRSMFTEAINRLQSLLNTLEDRNHTDAPVYWHTMALVAAIMGRRGDYIQSDQYGQRALAYFRENNDGIYLPMVMNGLAYNYMMFGRFDEARELSLESLELAKPLHGTDYEGIYAVANGNLGYIEFLAGNYERAKAIYEDLIYTLYTKDRSPIGYAFGMNNLGEICQAMGKFEAAEKMYRDAYDVFKEMGQRRGMAFTTNNLAGILYMQGDLEQSKELYQKAYRLNKEIGDRAGLGHSLSAIANIAFFVEKHYQEAYQNYKEAMELRKEIGDRIGYGRSAAEVGMTLYMMGHMDEARPYYEEALQIGEELDNRVVNGLAYLGMGGVCLYEGKTAEALDYLKQALKLAQMEKFSGETVFIIVATATIFEERGFDEQAAQLLGFIERHEAPEAAVITKPMLENLQYMLKNKLGSGYEREMEKGKALSITQILQIVESA